MRRLTMVVLLLALPALAAAQSSASYRVGQSTFNNGGNPSPELTSASYRVTLDAVGDAAAATGLSSASYGMGGGFPEGCAPPGEVAGLLFSGLATLVWNAEPSVGAYDLWRGDLSGLPGDNYGTKIAEDLASETASDSDTPPAGGCYVYLVTAENRLEEEGTKGYKSSGEERP